jgi:hypothetical protein
MARNFLCGHGGTHAEDQLDLASVLVGIASEVLSQHFAVEVEASERVRVSPAQAIGQTEVDDLLHFLIRRAGVRRP